MWHGYCDNGVYKALFTCHNHRVSRRQLTPTIVLLWFWQRRLLLWFSAVHSIIMEMSRTHFYQFHTLNDRLTADKTSFSTTSKWTHRYLINCASMCSRCQCCPCYFNKTAQLSRLTSKKDTTLGYHMKVSAVCDQFAIAVVAAVTAADVTSVKCNQLFKNVTW